MPDFLQSLLLPFCVVLFLAVTALRVKSLPPDKRKRTLNERWRFVRILLAGLLTLMAVNYRLTRTSHELDGKRPYDPGLLERIVLSITK